MSDVSTPRVIISEREMARRMSLLNGVRGSPDVALLVMWLLFFGQTKGP